MGATPVEEVPMDGHRTDAAGGQVAAHAADDVSPTVVSIMTTEYYTLQMGRAMTVADANGRATLFLGAVSTSLVALAFVGGMSHSSMGLGQAFYVFGVVLLPSLLFLGLVTFERVLQSAIEDAVYVRGSNRIRHLYVELAPEMRPYFILSVHDDEAAVMANMAMRWSWWQMFLTTAGTIAVLNSVLIGAFLGLLLAALVGSPLVVCAGVGGGAFLASVGTHQWYQWRRWGQHSATQAVRFPAGTHDGWRPSSTAPDT
jgi:hypothetical protein